GAENAEVLFNFLQSYLGELGISAVNSFARDGHTFDAQGGAGDGAAPFQIAADLGDVVQHLLQISRDRDLFDRKRKLAILDPQASRAAGEVSGDQVHAEAEKFSDVEAVR